MGQILSAKKTLQLFILQFYKKNMKICKVFKGIVDHFWGDMLCYVSLLTVS